MVESLISQCKGTPMGEEKMSLYFPMNLSTFLYYVEEPCVEAIDVAKSRKISIPNELSICGFDDNPLNINSPVGLATVAQPLVEMGRLGLEMLYQISHGKAKLPVKEVLAAKFIKAHSMAGPR